MDEKKEASQAEGRGRHSASVRPVSVDWISSSNSSAQDLSFEDMLGKFKSDSDEKMQALKRSSDSKRSGGYKRSSGGNHY